jgi:alpha-amylase
MLQGFHRTSSQSHAPSWHAIVAANAAVIRDAGFDLVWFPPVSESADGLGYLPTRWNTFDGVYGTQLELKAAIAALRPVRAIADVVVNHRCGVATAGADFDDPPFALDDQAKAVCRDDESGIGRGELDTGQGQPAARDLDHTNPAVRQAIAQYLTTLAGLGFEGWRYDQAKGYAGAFVGEYNQSSDPYLSVAEVWDGDRQTVMNYIDATGGRSMAFDFPTRMLLKAAIDGGDYSLLASNGAPAGAIGWWPAMSVTFLENHDTDKDAGPNSDEFGNGDQVLLGYAYLFTHPGIPCVFWSHFFDYGPAIQAQIRALLRIRKAQRLSRDSAVEIVAARPDLYAAVVDGLVAVKLGPASWSPGAEWSLATSGNDYAVWTRPSASNES